MEYFTIINFVLVFLGLLIGFVISKFLEKTSITKSLENAKKEIVQLKSVTGLQASVANDFNSIKGNVIYIDHFGNVVTNISKKQFLDVAKGRPYEIVMKTKNIKTILPNYSAVATNENYAIKNYEGEKLAIFNEAGFLEIAIFRSNPSKIGSANSLLGLSYRDVVLIQFKN